MNTELRRAIIGNSRIKITGKNETTSLKMISTETGASVEELQSLAIGEFHIKAGKAPSVSVKIPMIEAKQRIGKAEWKARLAYQKQRYYRPLEIRNTDMGQTSNSYDHSSGSNQTTPGPRRRRPAHAIKN